MTFYVNRMGVVMQSASARQNEEGVFTQIEQLGGFLASNALKGRKKHSTRKGVGKEG